MQEKFDYFNINIRIMQIMRAKGYNKNSLSKLLGISQPALKKIEDNENLPSFKLLYELKQAFPDINPDWLLTGEGEMLKTPPSETHNDKQSDDLQESLKQKDEQIEELTQRLREKELQLNSMIEIINKLSDK